MSLGFIVPSWLGGAPTSPQIVIEWRGFPVHSPGRYDVSDQDFDLYDAWVYREWWEEMEGCQEEWKY